MPTLIDIIYEADEGEGTIARLDRWLLAVGAEVAAETPIAEIETDKVQLEICAPEAGILHELVVEVGQELLPGAVLARMRARDHGLETSMQYFSEQPVDGSLPTETSADAQRLGKHRLSPSVRRLQKEHNVDLSQIQGSGQGGRVRKEDILAWVAEHAAVQKSAGQIGKSSSRRIPHTPMRRTIAKHMVDSLLHISPHVTSVFQADLGRIIDHRHANRTDFAAKGVRLTFTAYFLFAAAAALKVAPRVNARYHDDELELFEDLNLGVVTAMEDRGLIVPVIAHVQSMGLFEIAAALQDQTERGRAGRLSREDLAGGTFTLSNHGVSGSLFAAPIIINQPQVAILGVGKVEKRVMVLEIDGQDATVIRSMCYVSLSIDHRALDAFDANRWLSVFVDTLEAWESRQ